MRGLPFLLFLGLPLEVVSQEAAPSGLLVDYMHAPAVGVRSSPGFSWIVPPCSTVTNSSQTAYRIAVVDNGGATVWDSGKTSGSDSTWVAYAGAALPPASRFSWTVTTWATDACESSASPPSSFVTAPTSGFDASAQFIATATPCTFGYFRTEVAVPAGVVSAIAFVAAVNSNDRLLSAYKFYVDDQLVSIGPGRGEAPVFGGAGEFHNLPITTLDVTERFASAGTVALALQGMDADGPRVILELQLRTASGLTRVVTSSAWKALNADAHRRPMHGSGSAGVGFIENLDARADPVGWRRAGFVPDAAWTSAVAAAPSAAQLQNLYPRMELPIAVDERLEAASVIPTGASSFLADFGKEFQGGLRLYVPNGTAGTNVSIACGEALSGTKVESTWGWEFTWILRDGEQVLEQHKYMECRFVSLAFSVPAAAPAPNFTLSAWRANYPWYEEESMFTSDNATLNAVYDLCRYTLYSASLDTYTDSNTRERTPYEADGMIAMSGRLLVQRDTLYMRHSHAYVLQNPTWPVEWKQLDPFLGWQDFIATGQPDLALAFENVMHERTQISFLNASLGVLNTAAMGRHIVDWRVSLKHRLMCARTRRPYPPPPPSPFQQDARRLRVRRDSTARRVHGEQPHERHQHVREPRAADPLANDRRRWRCERVEVRGRGRELDRRDQRSHVEWKQFLRRRLR
jgi:hypothetical protein